MTNSQTQALGRLAKKYPVSSQFVRELVQSIQNLDFWGFCGTDEDIHSEAARIAIKKSLPFFWKENPPTQLFKKLLSSEPNQILELILLNKGERLLECIKDLVPEQIQQNDPLLDTHQNLEELRMALNTCISSIDAHKKFCTEITSLQQLADTIRENLTNYTLPKYLSSVLLLEPPAVLNSELANYLEDHVGYTEEIIAGMTIGIIENQYKKELNSTSAQY